MASQRARLPRLGSLGALTRPSRPPGASICPFCSVTSAGRMRPRTRRDARFNSTISNAGNPRAELEQHLLDMQKLGPLLVNPSRMQLALQGLRQAPGQEVVRVAILGLGPGSNAGETAKNVLRLLVTDPLKDEQEWERQLKDHDPKKPLIVRIRPTAEEQGILSVSKTNLLSEINVSSADWNNFNLELLFMETIIPYPEGDNYVARIKIVEDVLVPTVDIASAENRSTPITTPVHRALLVGDGMKGAVNATRLPFLEEEEAVIRAVNLKGIDRTQFEAPFETIDLASADKGMTLFRENTRNAMEYERLWTSSNLPILTTWLKSSVTSSEDTTKPAVRRLIQSILESVWARCKEENHNQIKDIHIKAYQKKKLALAPNLNEGLSEWAQKAHTELQDELDLAFTGQRWRKLGWWQLFWRVDDVAMLTNEMLSQRFLPTAEQELVYLTGQIAEAAKNTQQYPQPPSVQDAPKAEPQLKRLGSAELEPLVPVTTRPALPKWPGHIAFTRKYLQNETIPALQALAQKLVMQSLGTSGLTTSLAALLYVSSFSSTIYEAGAVAALGFMWSMSRLQKKWDAARTFWEGEVREEGRKAVRAVEESVADVLNGKEKATRTDDDEASKVLNEVRHLVTKASDALDRMK
ncbi:hypothetical protein CEP54_015321 [Fusarium duplospermum]|uniref:Mmc1 C-terminal domain-containing protein n=1 Tax=Fusarium duplospermum TaxID=1325734 RepID=A0A428NPY4_9HYPO|nr:hypothetical protein CEP54_015321 [Fusarium duplospermum]